MSLAIHEIAPDGDCLYASVIHQLRSRPDSALSEVGDVSELRKRVAEHLRRNRADFEPFMDMGDGSDFDTYCNKLETTHEWGGQVWLLMEL